MLIKHIRACTLARHRHNTASLLLWSILYVFMQGDLMLNTSELVIEFVLKLALNAEKLSDVEIDPSNTSVNTHLTSLFL